MLKKIIRRLKLIAMKNTTPIVITSVQAKALTYLDELALRELYETVKALEVNDIDGVLIEAGCALGGSAIVLASAKKQSRPFYVYDVFGMIPSPSEEDDADVHERYNEIVSGNSKGLHDNRYYGYEENLLDKVNSSFCDFDLIPENNNIFLVKGLFQDTMIISDPVLLVHIDGDWYDSVMVCLVRTVPYLVSGGVLIIDDYDAWSGCRKAVDDYFSDKKNEFKFIQKARLHITKK